MKIQRFENPDCWKESRKPVNLVYEAIRASKHFQNDYRLRDQSTGAALSVMGNIPEGFVRRSNKEFIQFLFISLSSAAELQSHMYIARDQKYIPEQTFENVYQQSEKTAKLISCLITYLRTNIQPNKPDKPN